MSNIIPGYTTPILTDFTQLNFSAGSTATDTSLGIKWYAVNTSGFQISILAKTAPATPWKATAHIRHMVDDWGSHRYGMAFRQSSNGYLQTTYAYNTGTDPLSIAGLQAKWNSYSSVNAYYDIAVPYALSWFQLGDDGTNKYSRISNDGINWTTVMSEARTTFLTADQVGIMVDPTAADIWIECDHFKLEAG